jgi:hypothetical protein
MALMAGGNWKGRSPFVAIAEHDQVMAYVNTKNAISPCRFPAFGLLPVKSFPPCALRSFTSFTRHFRFSYPLPPSASPQPPGSSPSRGSSLARFAQDFTQIVQAEDLREEHVRLRSDLLDQLVELGQIYAPQRWEGQARRFEHGTEWL